ncbi:MAG TPA: AmmeMemoRadiSam system protein B [Phycisphaerae bacterium]|nr:AmmeMemoRadiSam system protein B [Phycisphaerae bacterium]
MMASERQPAVAGRFYPGTSAACEHALDELVQGLESRAAIGAIVPHAGWVYSGRTAARGIAGVTDAGPETVVIFGAVHVLDMNDASVFSEGSWATPVGSVAIDEELGRRVAQSDLVIDDPAAHRSEHSIEVEVPIIQRLMGDVAILPVMVRPGPRAAEVGVACAEAARALGRRVVFVGSTDLTHYGPAFGFEPHGQGEEGIRWAKEVNDRRFITLIEALDADGVVPEAAANYNACGAGAVAATIAAARAAGAQVYTELEHITSADRDLAEGIPPLNSVGYEAGIFEQAS